MALAVMAVVGWPRAGFGWIFTLGTANVVRSWMSPPTLLARAPAAGILLRLGDHTTAVLSLTRGIGVLIIAVMVGWLLVAVCAAAAPVGGWRGAGRHGPAVPVVQPWYLLWAIIPLAAWATRPGFRVRRSSSRSSSVSSPDGQRRPFRVVPNRGRHTGQYRDRGAADRHDLHALAVAPTADRHSRAPSRGGD
ncbi:hypothetical protein I552_0030 [Mycobacterium xenopi 3993]|nr:hypothetical protein I552_0030 [Mycobacterium xenopi 3993]